ncbi:uncharacterized protein LOC122853143 isoform X2 [Aphidius gifuensis]|nr:uncharacterized protein LOC122853143 isoform X2 [Aphidius gifuensis]
MILLGYFLLEFITPARGINCYQCSSTNNVHPFQCNEYMSEDIDISPTDCSDVWGAKYCVKHVGRFEAWGIKCYQCSTESEWKCQDASLTVEALQPTSCDYLDGAKYCIKTSGRYGGGVGTKRFCSSANLGNDCHYTNTAGDDQNIKYRTCIYTCDSDGCNSATKKSTNIIVFISLLIAPIVYLFQR